MTIRPDGQLLFPLFPKNLFIRQTFYMFFVDMNIFVMKNKSTYY